MSLFTAPLPNMGGGGGMHFDAQYHYWYTNFAWWYFGGGDHGITYHSTDPKVPRISYSLAGLLARDRMTKEQVDKLANLKFKVFDFSVDADLVGWLEAIGVKLEVIKPQEVSLYIAHQPIQTNQIIILNGLIQPSKDLMQVLTNFVNDGGRLLIFNCASNVIAAMFPGKITPLPPSTLLCAKVHFPGPEIDLFSSFTQNEMVDVEYSRYPIEVPDRNEVKVLAELKGRQLEPVVSQWDYGAVSVYLFVSRLFLHEKTRELVSQDLSHKIKVEDAKNEKDAKKDEKSGNDSNEIKETNSENTKIDQVKEIKEEPKNDVEQMNVDGKEKKEKKVQSYQQRRKRPPPPKKQKKGPAQLPPDFDSYLNTMGASNDTVVAWKCAIQVGYIEAYVLAKRVIPSIEMMAKLLLKQQAFVDHMFSGSNEMNDVKQEGTENYQQEGQE